MPFFDAAQLVNNLTLDATDPLSKETGFQEVRRNWRRCNALCPGQQTLKWPPPLLRDMVRAAGGLAVVGVALGLQQQTARATGVRLRPPCALSEEASASACVRCGQCVQACPATR